MGRTVFYVGGFEAIGGIEAFLFDLLTNLPAGGTKRSMLIWGDDVPALRGIERAGTEVLRTSLRWGCRFGLPDRLLFARFGKRLRDADRIVFAKIPPRPIFERIVRTARARRPASAEIVYVTPYRPSEMWPDGMRDDILRGFDRILVQSSEFADDLRQMGFSGAVELVPYIPPAAAATPTEPPRQGRTFRLGFLGRFVAQKNLFYLLDILAALQPGAIELHLFGSGGDEDALREAAGKRGLPAIFHGSVPREAVPATIDGCDAFINPSISEGQCLVAFEVLSRGRPFIATPVGAIPEILGKGRLGVTIPLDDAQGAAAIVRAFIEEWNMGEWRASDIAAAYAVAYPRAEIISDYEKLL
ncbi:MAG: glycosyltransferase family 4 protein [Sphingomonas sp.]|jgi:glycosyltransferase involved in cell wall biosynthesis